MPLDLFEGIKSVEKSPDFAEDLRGSYLCSAISFVQPGHEPESWDLNYYSPKKHEIEAINVSESGIIRKGCDKPFKDTVPKKVDVEKVSVNFREALVIAESLRTDSSKDRVNRIFASLYTEDTEIWSVSFILSSMQILQVKIDASSGKALDSKVHNMVQKTGAAI